MKLRVGKSKEPPRAPGRQRRHTERQAPPSAFSYYSQRSERPDAPGRQQSSLVDQRHRMLSLRFWARRSGLLIALIASLVCLVSILSLSTSPRIVFMDKDGAQYAFHQSDTYADSASAYLAGSFWNRNKITANTGAAAADLKRQYPELSNVVITLPLVGHRPIYYLYANKPTFVIQAVNGTYVLDSTGRVMITKDAAPKNVVSNLPVIADQSGIHAKLGKQALSSSETQFIKTVVATLAAKNVTVTSLVLPADAVQQLNVKVDNKPYIIKFNMHDTNTARQQVGSYLATEATLAGQNTVPAQYIDVRVLGRAYYQ